MINDYKNYNNPNPNELLDLVDLKSFFDVFSAYFCLG